MKVLRCSTIKTLDDFIAEYKKSCKLCIADCKKCPYYYLNHPDGKKLYEECTDDDNPCFLLYLTEEIEIEEEVES